jgi:hypothetical protein
MHANAFTLQKYTSLGLREKDRLWKLRFRKYRGAEHREEVTMRVLAKCQALLQTAMHVIDSLLGLINA